MNAANIHTIIKNANSLDRNAQSREVFAKDKLFYIISNKEKYEKIINSIDDQYDAFDRARKYYMLSTDGLNGDGYINVNYRPRDCPRLFAEHGISMQGLHKKIRNTISRDYYKDVDIVNAHPTILEWVCYHLNIKCSVLSAYVKNRQFLLDGLLKYEFEPSYIKQMIVSTINGGFKDYYAVMECNDKSNVFKWLKCFFKELKNVRGELCQKFPNKIPELLKEEKYNIEGKLTSHVMSSVEATILDNMIEYFQSKNIVSKIPANDVKCFDGALIPTGDYDLIECEAYIKNRVGIDIKLKIKPSNDILYTSKRIRKKHKDDIFMYHDLLSEVKTYKAFKSIKYEVVEFINKNTWYIRGSKPLIIREVINTDVEEFSTDAIERVYMCPKTFESHLSNCNFSCVLSKEEMKKHGIQEGHLGFNAYKLWMGSMHRNDRDRVVFNPAILSSKNTYNLFDGLCVSSSACANVVAYDETHEFFNHIKKRWCGGDEVDYNYILNWFASIIQHPEKKLKNSLVLKSRERAGKGIIIQTIAKILGKKYFFHPTNQKSILGDFNSNMAGKLLVFLDELAWGGDRQAAGVFKKLISEETISINKKYQSEMVLDNYANIIIASNEEWVVPAGINSKRFKCQNVSNELSTCDDKTRRKIVSDILNLDIKRLAKFFYERDITDFDSNEFPITECLREQRIYSMSKIYKWWYDALCCGWVESGDNTFSLTGKISRKKLYHSYTYHSRDNHLTMRSFLKQFRELSNADDVQMREGGRKSRGFEFKSIDDMQKVFRGLFNDPDMGFEDIDEEIEDSEIEFLDAEVEHVELI